MQLMAGSWFIGAAASPALSPRRVINDGVELINDFRYVDEEIVLGEFRKQSGRDHAAVTDPWGDLQLKTEFAEFIDQGVQRSARDDFALL
jgi:hypothetical protein